MIVEEAIKIITDVVIIVIVKNYIIIIVVDFVVEKYIMDFNIINKSKDDTVIILINLNLPSVNFIIANSIIMEWEIIMIKILCYVVVIGRTNFISIIAIMKIASVIIISQVIIYCIK